MPKKFLEAGKIVGTHGVRGDLKVQSWCDSPEVLCDFDTPIWTKNACDRRKGAGSQECCAYAYQGH